MKFLIITGRSGSGKSHCLHLLEDLGYYCIDNLPLSLLPSLPQHLRDKTKIAVGVDVRNLPSDPQMFSNVFDQLTSQKLEPTVLYLDTSNKVLLERFSSTRRKHPLSNADTSLLEALSTELELLEPLQQLAKYRIDTSRLSIHDLQRQLKEMEGADAHTVTILFQSFGFKYGLPTDSDYVFDVRCLANPYWDKSLRALTGLDDKVINFFSENDDVKKMLGDLSTFLENWLPLYRKDNRNYMTFSVGCTGGQHRSVYIANCLYEHFKNLAPEGLDLQLRHRELN
jgi:UPF0042 nucleotide-binding protein